MIRKIIHYFERSIRNKLMVALPIVIAFILLFMFTMSILSMRKQVIDQMIGRGKEKIAIVERRVNRGSVHGHYERFLSEDNIVYVKIFDSNGNLQVGKAISDTYLNRSDSSSTLLEESDQIVIKEVSIPGNGDVIEFNKKIPSGEITLGLSLTPVKKLIFSQTMILLGICVVALLAIVVIIATIGRYIGDPIKRLLEEADKIADDQNSLQQLSLADRKDEVGSLARKLNTLINRVKHQQEELADQKVDAAMGKIASQVAHDIRSPLSSLQSAAQYLSKVTVADSSFSDYVNLLELGTKRLTGIADDLLNNNQRKWFRTYRHFFTNGLFLY